MIRGVPLLLIAMLLGLGMPAMAAPAINDKILRIGVAVVGESLEIRAIGHVNREPHIAPAGSIARMESIFFSLECFVNSDCSNLKSRDDKELTLLGSEELAQALADEGTSLLGPFADLIAAAEEVNFQVDWPILKLPFDLLHFRGDPLFVTKRISYTVGGPGQKWRVRPGRSWSGLLVSDETADPERAVLAIGNTFPRSTSFDLGEFDLSKLRALQPVDFVAISAHGFVDEDGNGYIGLANGERLEAGVLAGLRPKLVYFDSCNLGISADHLKALRDGGTIYAVAPILSNEAGDSSTATIDVFFSELANGVEPTNAMFLARSKLYDQYRADDFRTMLWRSFPFRVYRLN